TNHLDNDTKDALRKAIINFSGGVIIVSHERDFFRGDWIDKTIDIETMN
ncbi:ABC transporter ATP-binding protein, partial [Salmonella enterica subsp. enterica serovar Enteritidis]|nr:ABC transporter ATP-binding protein [Salmonella enterica subsp. enterica serovar Enteritidis]